VPVDAYLPPDYIEDERQKIDAYKRIAGADSLEVVREIEEELEDRFGPLPLSAQHLLAVARLRILGEKVGLGAIRVDRQKVHFVFERMDKVPPGRLEELGRSLKGRASFAAGKSPEVTIRLGGDDPLSETEEVLRALTEGVATAVS